MRSFFLFFPLLLLERRDRFGIPLPAREPPSNHEQTQLTRMSPPDRATGIWVFEEKERVEVCQQMEAFVSFSTPLSLPERCSNSNRSAVSVRRLSRRRSPPQEHLPSQSANPFPSTPFSPPLPLLPHRQSHPPPHLPAFVCLRATLSTPSLPPLPPPTPPSQPFDHRSRRYQRTPTFREAFRTASHSSSPQHRPHRKPRGFLNSRRQRPLHPKPLSSPPEWRF